MMNVKFCRIDDRLIHGQVVTTWVNVHKIEQIIILNEAVEKDKIQTNVLKMSSPPNIKLHVFSPEKFMEIIKTNPIKRSTMLLFSSVFDVEKIVDLGFSLERLNIGGMRLNGDRERLTKAVALSPSEKEVFKKLMDKGTVVEIQMVPSDSAENLKGVI